MTDQTPDQPTTGPGQAAHTLTRSVQGLGLSLAGLHTALRAWTKPAGRYEQRQIDEAFGILRAQVDAATTALPGVMVVPEAIAAAIADAIEAAQFENGPPEPPDMNDLQWAADIARHYFDAPDEAPGG